MEPHANNREADTDQQHCVNCQLPAFVAASVNPVFVAMVHNQTFTRAVQHMANQVLFDIVVQ